MNIRPLYDRIVVKRLDEEADKTAGGLFIPDSAKEKPMIGEVLAVGQGKRNTEGKIIPLDVKVGDRVLFSKYAGNEVPKAYGEDHMVMREEDILGIILDAPKLAKKSA
jgi:chaperonin GroES